MDETWEVRRKLKHVHASSGVSWLFSIAVLSRRRAW
jgi:hypothetical protein